MRLPSTGTATVGNPGNGTDFAENGCAVRLVADRSPPVSRMPTTPRSSRQAKTPTRCLSTTKGFAPEILGRSGVHASQESHVEAAKTPRASAARQDQRGRTSQQAADHGQP